METVEMTEYLAECPHCGLVMAEEGKCCECGRFVRNDPPYGFAWGDDEEND